jgi:hypothetical protein
MEVCGGIAPPFLTSVLDVGDPNTLAALPPRNHIRWILYRRLRGPQSCCGENGEEKNILPLSRFIFLSWDVQPVA